MTFLILFFISIQDHLKWKWCKFHNVLKCVIATRGHWIIGNSMKCVHVCGFIRIKYLWNKTLKLEFTFRIQYSVVNEHKQKIIKSIMNDWMDKRKTEEFDCVQFQANLSSFRGIRQIRLRSEKQKKLNKNYLFVSWINLFNNFVISEWKKGMTSVTVCLTIDDTSDVKISFYFRQEDGHSSIIEKKIEKKAISTVQTGFHSANTI